MSTPSPSSIENHDCYYYYSQQLPTNNTIDDALQSLYDATTTTATTGMITSSYSLSEVTTTEDGIWTATWDDERRETFEMVQFYEQSSNLQHLLQQISDNDEPVVHEEASQEEDGQDDEEFGDFQSAPPLLMLPDKEGSSPGAEAEEQRLEGVLPHETTTQSPTVSVQTPALIRQAEQYLSRQHSRNSSTVSSQEDDDDTVTLVRHMDDILLHEEKKLDHEDEEGPTAHAVSSTKPTDHQITRRSICSSSRNDRGPNDNDDDLPEDEKSYDEHSTLSSQSDSKDECAHVASSPKTDTPTVVVAVATLSPEHTNNTHTTTSDDAHHDQQQQQQLLQQHSQWVRRLLPESPQQLVSLTVPLDDWSTLEARYTQRRQQHLHYQLQQQPATVTTTTTSTSSSSFSSPHQRTVLVVTELKDLELPSYYYTHNDMDDTVPLLQSLPWHFLRKYSPPTITTTTTSTATALKDQDDWQRWDAYMIDKLCVLDTALQSIRTHLLLWNSTNQQQQQPHDHHNKTAKLDWTNALWHEWDRNLRLALLYWERTREQVDVALGDECTGVTGAQVLVEAWERKADYRRIHDTLSQLTTIMESESDMVRRIDSFDTKETNSLHEYFSLTQLALDLRARVAQAPFSDLLCLNELRERLTTIRHRLWARLLRLSQVVVVRSCNNPDFDWMEYERLVEAVLHLHAHPSEDGIVETNNVDLPLDWFQSISSALCHEASRSLAMALLERSGAEPSEFNKELEQIAREIDSDWGDDTKLRTLTHNLVTIRFNFECDKGNLPKVCQELLLKLWNVLHTHFLVTQWHEAPFDDRSRDKASLHVRRDDASCDAETELERILGYLRGSRETLWNHCMGVLLHFFEEFLHFGTKPILFTYDGTMLQDEGWQRDVLGLEQVLFLVDRFLRNKSHFTRLSDIECCLSSLPDGSDTDRAVYDVLTNVCRKHLRFLHVESMNAMGRLLAHEAWVLRNVDDNPTGVGREDLSRDLQALRPAARAMLALPDSLHSHDPFSHRLDPFIRFAVDGNPFASPVHNLSQSKQSEAEIKKRNSIMLPSPASIVDGLVGWFRRLAMLMLKAPLIAEDSSAVLANLCDLYFTTVFRLCSGNAKKERVLLGAAQPSPFVIVRNDSSKAPSKRSSASPLFGFGKTNRQSDRPVTSPRALVPSGLEAELCAPLPRDAARVSRLRMFLERAQHALIDVVNLDMVDSWLIDPPTPRGDGNVEERACATARVLERRQSAIWSCSVVAVLAEATYSHVASNIGMSLTGSCNTHALMPINAFIESIIVICPTFSSVASQISCARAIVGQDIVKRILEVGTGWEECKLQEQPNDYVDEIVELCSLVWGFIFVSAKLPEFLRSRTWADLVASIYNAMLDGFARVPVCSTEGRALMTLDLASLSAGLTPAVVLERLQERALLALSPPSVLPSRSKSDVEKYIKVFYFPREDISRWIHEHWKDYQLNHSIALITASSTVGETDSASLVQEVKDIYKTHPV